MFSEHSESRKEIRNLSLRPQKITKDRLDKNRAPGQCYDGFICQLVDLWERIKEGKRDYVLNTSGGGDA